MADIRKREGKKGATYQVRYPDTTKKTGYAFATFKTMKEARAFSENSTAWNSNSSNDSMTVADAVDMWLDICEKVGRDGRETVEPQTLVEYKRRASIIKEYHWPVQLAQIDPKDVVQFRTWLLEKKSRDLAKRTLSSLHSVFIEMKLQGYISHDPASGVTVRSSGRHEKQEVEIPTDDELRRILASIDDLAHKNKQLEKTWRRYKPMIYLAAFSGMRPSEYRGLAWENVSERSVVVSQRADKTGLIGSVKSRAAKRTIYLPKFVTDMLEQWRPHCPKSERNLVFPTAQGKPIALAKIRAHCWIPLLTEAGVVNMGKKSFEPIYTMYCLRHYYASKLIESGKDAKFIQTMMGHSSIEITYNVYGHLIEGKEKEHQDNAEQIASFILGGNSCGKFVADRR